MTNTNQKHQFRAGFETALADFCRGATTEQLCERLQPTDELSWAWGFESGIDWLEGWVTSGTDLALGLDLPKLFSLNHPTIAHRLHLNSYL